MALHYKIDSDQGVIHSRFEGEITVELLQDYNLRLRQDPAFRTGLSEIVEVKGVEAKISFSAMRDYRNWFLQLEPIRMTAIVATDDASFGMARMFQQLSDQGQTKIQVFRDMKSARLWLSLRE